MKKSTENLRHELAGIRTGKANPALLDTVKVSYYGQTVPLKQVASIAVPEARLITVQPWEKSLVPEVEKAILASELGLNPQSDGTLIRLPIPPLTEERRKEQVLTMTLTDSLPTRCPSSRGKSRLLAHRPLPSIIIAMCAGRFLERLSF